MAITDRDIDKKTLSAEDYIFKYYAQVKLDGWNYWMNNTINKAWEKSKRLEFLKDWGERMKYFDFSEMERFYKEEDLSDFDEDVKKFISFLAGDGFFLKNKISFSEWLSIRNFTNPYNSSDQHEINISQFLKISGGMNYLREQLTGLSWWRQ